MNKKESKKKWACAALLVIPTIVCNFIGAADPNALNFLLMTPAFLLAMGAGLWIAPSLSWKKAFYAAIVFEILLQSTPWGISVLKWIWETFWKPPPPLLP